LDKLDAEFGELIQEKNELEERCKSLESELNSRVFVQQIDGDDDLVAENEYLREQL